MRTLSRMAFGCALGLLVVGCGPTSGTEVAAVAEPRLGPGFLLPIDLDAAAFPNLASFAQAALVATWEDQFEFSTSSETGQTRSVAECMTLLSGELSLDDVIPSHDWTAAQARDRMCRAAELIADSQAATSSRWPERILTPAAPEALPADVVLNVSGDQEAVYQQRVAAGLSRWYEHESVAWLEGDEGDAAVFLSESDMRYVLEVVARADFDGDGREDVLLLVTASPQGGSLVSHRLLLLGADGDAWQVKAEWGARH